MHVHLLEQMTIGQVRKLFLGDCEGRKPLLDYFVSASKHYFDPSLTIDDNKAYVTKEGILFQHTLEKPKKRKATVDLDASNLPDQLPEKEDADILATIYLLPKKQRYTLAQKYLGIDESIETSPIAMYELMHRTIGFNTAKAFFTELYHTTQGLSVRKAFPAAREGIIYPRSDEIEFYWITGPAGKGKTTFVNVLYPGNYVKNKDTVYWESYNFNDHSKDNPHMCVLFNELDTTFDLMAFSPNQKSFDTIKNMLDIKPFPIEIKHQAQQQIRPRRIYITSNTDLTRLMLTLAMQARHDTPSNPFYGLDVQTLKEALMRRLIQLTIDELLDTYNCFCIKTIEQIRFGGVFHNSLRTEIETRMQMINEDNLTYLEKFQEYVDLRTEMELRTIELLAPLRWVPIEQVKFAQSPPTHKDIRNAIYSSFGG